MDLGELPDESEELYASAQVANIACGGHAGDDASMRRALELCRAHGVRLGAHPSYPDRSGFGRRPLTMSAKALRDSIAHQCAQLASIAREYGASIVFVKPHGALYHDARRDDALAEALIGGARRALGANFTMIGPAWGACSRASTRAHLAYAREGFADRAIRPDGSLVPRDEPGALVLDPAIAAERARAIGSSGEVDTICVHGDTPGAAGIARAVRAALDALGMD
jgi:UPF0271 protein